MPTLFSKPKAKTRSTVAQETAFSPDDYVADEQHRHEGFMSMIRARQRATIERIVHYSRREELRSQDFQEFVAKANKEHDGNEARRRGLFAEAMKKQEAIAQKHENRRVKEFADDLLIWSKGIEEEKQRIQDAFQEQLVHLNAMSATGYQAAEELCCRIENTLETRFDEIIATYEASFRHNEQQRDGILQDLLTGRPLKAIAEIQPNPIFNSPLSISAEPGTYIGDYPAVECEDVGVSHKEETDRETPSHESSGDDTDIESLNNVDASLMSPNDEMDLEVVTTGLPQPSSEFPLPIKLEDMLVKSQETPAGRAQSERFSAFQEWRRASIAKLEEDEARMWKDVEAKHETVKQLRHGIWTRTLKIMRDRLGILILDFDDEYESVENLRNEYERRRNAAFERTQRTARDAYWSSNWPITSAIDSKEEAQRDQSRVLWDRILGLWNQRLRRLHGSLDDTTQRFNERQSNRLIVYRPTSNEGEYLTVFQNETREWELRAFEPLAGYDQWFNRNQKLLGVDELAWSNTQAYGLGFNLYKARSSSSGRKKHKEVPFGLAMLFRVGNMPSSLPLPRSGPSSLKEQLREEYTRFIADQGAKYAVTTQEQEAKHALEETIRQYGYDQDQRVRRHQFDTVQTNQDKKVMQILSGFNKIFFEQEAGRQQRYLTAGKSRARAYERGKERRLQRLTETFNVRQQRVALFERGRLRELVDLGNRMLLIIAEKVEEIFAEEERNRWEAFWALVDLVQEEIHPVTN